MLRYHLFLITIVRIQTVAKMSITHRFLEHDFGNSFATHNAILDTTPDYEPEVLFIGTYNPDVDDKANVADFLRQNFF